MPTYRCKVMLLRHRPRWETRKHRIDKLSASRLEDVEVSTFRVRIPYLTCFFLSDDDDDDDDEEEEERTSTQGVMYEKGL